MPKGREKLMFDVIAKKTGQWIGILSAGAGALLSGLIFLATLVYYTSACMRGTYAWTDVASCMAVVAFLWMLVWAIQHRLRLNAMGVAVVVMVLAFICHVVVIRLTHALCAQTMYSDFLRVQKCVEAEGVVFSHAPMHFYWCNFELLVSVLGKVFCRDMQVVQYLNALACSIVLIPFYLLSERVSSRGWALAASLALGMSPSMLMYGTMLSSEFVGMALLMGAFWFFLEMLRTRDDLRTTLSMAVGCGVLLGGSQLMKPMGALFVMAALVVLVQVWSKSVSKAAALRLGACFLVMVVAYKGTYQGGQSAFSALAGPKVELKSSVNLPRMLAVGLNTESKGGFSEAFCAKLYNMTEAEQRDYLKGAIKRDFWKYPALFARKFAMLYNNEWWGFGCYSRTIAPVKIAGWVPRKTDSWYFMSAGLAALGALGFLVFLWKNGFGDEAMPGLMALLLLLAFTALEMLIEVQGRYRSSLYPLYFMMVPYCRIWFEADNPLYGKIVKTIKRKAV